MKHCLFVLTVAMATLGLAEAKAEHASVASNNTFASAGPCSAQVVTPDIAAKFPGANRVQIVPRYGLLGARRGETTYVFQDSENGSRLLGVVDNNEGPLGFRGRTDIAVAPGASAELSATPDGC